MTEILLVCEIIPDLEECYLAPLKKLFVAKDVHFQYLTVSALTRLLGNLAAFEWPRMEQRRREEEDLLTQHYRYMYMTVIFTISQNLEPHCSRVA